MRRGALQERADSVSRNLVRCEVAISQRDIAFGSLGLIRIQPQQRRRNHAVSEAISRRCKQVTYRWIDRRVESLVTSDGSFTQEGGQPIVVRDRLNLSDDNRTSALENLLII